MIATAGHQVEVETHKTLNRVKGVVRSLVMGQNTEAELLECLEEQGVTDISRVTIKKNQEIIKTNTYILQFQRHEVPKTVRISDWHGESVEEYKSVRNNVISAKNSLILLSIVDKLSSLVLGVASRDTCIGIVLALCSACTARGLTTHSTKSVGSM